MVDPDVVVLVNRQTADQTDELIVGERLGPGCVNRVARRVVGLSVSRCSEPNREEYQDHDHRGATNRSAQRGFLLAHHTDEDKTW